MDELPELEEIRSVGSSLVKLLLDANTATPLGFPSGSPSGSTEAISAESDDHGPWTPRSLYSGTQFTVSPSKRRRITESSGFCGNTGAETTNVGFDEILPSHHQRIPSLHRNSLVPGENDIDCLLRVVNTSAHGKNLGSSPLPPGTDLDVEVQPQTPGIWPHASLQEACFMKYFIDELACWVHNFH